MNTIRGFAADRRHNHFRRGLRRSHREELRVTVIATGLGQPQITRQAKPKLVQKTGTDNMPVAGWITRAR